MLNDDDVFKVIIEDHEREALAKEIAKIKSKLGAAYSFHVNFPLLNELAYILKERE